MEDDDFLVVLTKIQKKFNFLMAKRERVEYLRIANEDWANYISVFTMHYLCLLKVFNPLTYHSRDSFESV